MRLFCLLVSLFLFAEHGYASTLKSTESFLADAFAPQGEPKSEVLWLNKKLKQQISEEIGYQMGQIRVRYWGLEHKTAWILEEVGKEQPITIGVVVDNNEVSQLDILVYRESRGWEVKHGFFTRQFHGAKIVKNRDSYRLSEHIDGITGATLSVRAVKKVATLALFLHQLTPYFVHGQEK